MLTIIGCGNLNRSDDGVGVIVARRLMEHVRKLGLLDVRVFDAGTGGMDVMFRARGANELVLVDASRSGSTPGAVFRVPGKDLERDYEPAYSLHDFRWDHALHAGRRIFGASFPSDVTVYLIEAGRLDLGFTLSEPVRLAAERVAAEIEAMIERRGAVSAAHAVDERGADIAAAEPIVHTVRVARGSIYLDRELCERHLAGVESVATLLRDGRALLVPLHGGAAGGLLLKIRNARGDRVVHATDFLRTLGIDQDTAEFRVPVQWDSGAAGLVLEEVARAAHGALSVGPAPSA